MNRTSRNHSDWDRFVLVVILALVFIMAARTPLDSDMWWHLKSGEVGSESGRPLLVDMFSYTRFQERWTNHSWLSEIGLFQLFKWGNYWGLSAWVACLAVLSLLLPILQMESPMLLRGFLAVLGSMVCAVVWSPRPQMTSLVCLAGLSLLIHRARQGEIRFLWGIPVLFLIWSNLHAGYALGFILIAFVFAGEGLNFLSGNQSGIGFNKNGIIRFGWMSLIAFGCVAINPNGIHMWSIPFETVGVQSLQSLISEWASPDFHKLVQQPFLWMLCGSIVLMGISRCKTDAVELICFAGFAGMSLIARRNFAPFALVSLPIISRHAVSAWQVFSPRILENPILGKFFQRDTGIEKHRPVPAWLPKTMHLTIAGFLFVVAIIKLFWVAHPAMISYYETELYPAEAVNWIQEHPVEGHLFSEYDWGGYLIWHLDAYPVFVDGRTDLFGDPVIIEWKKLVNAETGWQDVLGKWKINSLLVRTDRPIVTALEGEEWQRVYEDDQVVLIERSDP